MLNLYIFSAYLENMGTRFEWRNGSAQFHLYVFRASAHFVKRHSSQRRNRYYLLHNPTPNS